jgi:hypothetical protein
MLPVLAKIPVAGLYSSAEFKYVHEFADGQLIPPAISIAPLFNSVALC